MISKNSKSKNNSDTKPICVFRLNQFVCFYCCCFCFSYASCSQELMSHHSQQTDWECVNMKRSGSHGYIMKTKCPRGSVEPEIQTLCETVNGTDFLRGMPVVDEQTGVAYRNVFCARCNSVQSVSYWRMTADCGRIPASALPQDSTLLLAFIRENCTVNYNPTDSQKKYLKICLVADNRCSSNGIFDKEPILQDLCSYYAFPICGNTAAKNLHCELCNGYDITQSNCGCLASVTTGPLTHKMSTVLTNLPHTLTPQSTSQPYKTNPGTTPPPHTTNPGTTPPPYTSNPGTTNPLYTTNPGTTHVLHNTNPGSQNLPHTTTHQPPTTPPRPWTTPLPYYTTSLPQVTEPKTPPVMMTTRWPVHSVQPPPPPPLSILFDFSSNEISIQGKTTETKVVEQKTCQDGFVYDPFLKECRKTYLKVIVNTNSTINSSNSNSGFVIMLNCSTVQLNLSDTLLYPNGTLWVPLYATEYNRTDYIVNGSYVFLCTNFAGNYSKRETIKKWSYVVSSLQILTYAGCSVSVLSLLILLVIYCIFKELRTLPGKSLINLSFAMIFYHAFLFVAGFRNIQALCTGIALLLHYFLLSSFAWMSIMAFDVAKTFVFHGKKRR